MARPVLCTRTLALVLLLLAPGPGQAASAQVRHARPGTPMEPFTLPDVDGRPFTFPASPGRVSALLFLAAHQKRSERAITDLAGVAARLRRDGHAVDLMIVVSGGEELAYFRDNRQAWAPDAAILVDADDALWGRLGIAVAPTTLLIDGDGRIAWIRAGHAYDYATEARDNLHRALGLEAPSDPDDEDHPAPEPAGATVDERLGRHLRMAEVLARRGKLDAAIVELRKADELASGAVTVRLALARLLCRTERPGDALAALENIEPTTELQTARAKTMAGWAHRQLGDLDRALTLLTEAAALDPASDRALFEMGKVYQERGECERAMAAYRGALEVRFGEETG